MPGSLRIGRLIDIDIYAHVSWFLIFVLLTWSLASDWFPQFSASWTTGTYWLAAIFSTILLFIGVLIHEIAHALIARAYGLRIKGITLFVFGGVAEIEQEIERPGVEFKIAIAGPIASFVLAMLAFLLALPFRGNTAPAEAVLEYLAVMNLILALFNLVPGFPLDGGRILHSIIWKGSGDFQKATRIASAIGQGCGYLFILAGIIAFFTVSFFDGLWIVFTGWFLLSAAQSANAQAMLHSTLQGVTVAQVMNPQPVTVPANISLQKLVDEYFLPHNLRAAPVLQGDYLCGLVTLSNLSRIEQSRWSYTPVGHVMHLIEKIHVATPDQSLHDVLQEMVSHDINQMPVVQDGRLVGLLSRESIVRYLQTRPLQYAQSKAENPR